MSAKKINARKRPEAKRAKPAKAKTPARKTFKSKSQPKDRAKAVAKKPVAKTASKKLVQKLETPKPIAKAAASVIVLKPVTPKPLATAKKAAAPSAKAPRAATFDPERRRELIAAAAARRRKTQINRVAPIAIIQPRASSPVERHRFSVGDEVRVISTSGMWFKHGVDYRITAALPPQAGKLQYRIKNEQEPFERVVSESQLASPMQHAQL